MNPCPQCFEAVAVRTPNTSARGSRGASAVLADELLGRTGAGDVTGAAVEQRFRGDFGRFRLSLGALRYCQ